MPRMIPEEECCDLFFKLKPKLSVVTRFAGLGPPPGHTDTCRQAGRLKVEVKWLIWGSQEGGEPPTLVEFMTAYDLEFQIV